MYLDLANTYHNGTLKAGLKAEEGLRHLPPAARDHVEAFMREAGPHP